MSNTKVHSKTHTKAFTSAFGAVKYLFSSDRTADVTHNAMSNDKRTLKRNAVDLAKINNVW